VNIVRLPRRGVRYFNLAYYGRVLCCLASWLGCCVPGGKGAANVSLLVK
jgi:hypothetical protein